MLEPARVRAGETVLVSGDSGGVGWPWWGSRLGRGARVIAGAVAGPVIEMDLRRLYLRSISLLGSTMHTPKQFEVLVAAANAGEVAPAVARRFRLEEPGGTRRIRTTGACRQVRPAAVMSGVSFSAVP